MTLLALIVILAYLVAIIDGAIQVGRFIKGVERDAMRIISDKRKRHHINE